MRQYECDLCGYVWQPAARPPAIGQRHRRRKWGPPADWVCPLCGAGKDEFTAKK